MTTNLDAAAQLFWDDQDPSAAGWTLRYSAEGQEENATIDGDEDATLDDLELAAELALGDYSGNVKIYRGEQVARTFALRGVTDEELIARDAKIEGRHAEAKAIREGE